MPEPRNIARSAAAAAPVTVLVVDDQTLFLAAVRDLVNSTGGMVVIAEACSGEGALQAADRLAPQLVIMDVRMPGMGGIEASRRLAASHPATVVILVSADADHAYTARSSGAAAFLCKEQLSGQALRALWDAHRLPTADGR